jgi:DNA-binding transcriptional regulator YhcF (GntR family)
MEKADARYLAIAYQIAKRISQGELNEGMKLSGRTLMSSEYQVSSETIRKAIKVLETYGVVVSKERSGVTILSAAAATSYMERYVAQKEDRRLIQDTLDALKDLSQAESHAQQLARKLISVTRTGFFPFDFFTLEITTDSPWVGRTLQTIDLKRQAGALVIGYEKDGLFYQNPDAELLVDADMRLYLLGDLSVQKKTEGYMHGNPQSDKDSH